MGRRELTSQRFTIQGLHVVCSGEEGPGDGPTGSYHEALRVVVTGAVALVVQSQGSSRASL